MGNSFDEDSLEDYFYVSKTVFIKEHFLSRVILNLVLS